MANILLLESATDICSVGIAQKGKLIALSETARPFKHTSHTTLFIQDCLKKGGLKIKDLDAVAVSSGPGSYTSLRVGTATAKGICYALNIPLISVDTLQSLALASANKWQRKDALYAPMIDARRMEVYTATYNYDNNPVTKTQALIVDSSTFDIHFATQKTVIFSGNGAAKLQTTFPSSQTIFDPLLCSAQHLIPLAWEAFQLQKFCDLAYYEPLYLKSPNITKPKKVW